MLWLYTIRLKIVEFISITLSSLIRLRINIPKHRANMLDIYVYFWHLGRDKYIHHIIQ